MKTQDDPPTKIAELPLTAFELPTWLVEPAVRSCRLFNTALDFIFYDVPTLRAALAQKDAPMQARGEKPPSRIQTWLATAAPETARIRWPPWRSGCRVPAFPCGNSRRRLAT